jgi:hypothetical protein
MLFYLGTHEPSWLRRLDVPLFVSARRLRRLQRPPRAVGRWALDSGGFSELSLFGQWKTSPDAYAAEVDRWADEVGGLDWAAPQDWMCEPTVRARTGLTVEEHQRRTVASVVRLRQLVRRAKVIPVLQGWRVPDYIRCAAMYADAGIDLTAEPTVGLGTVCRRQSTVEGAEIVRSLARCGIRLHGFGFKRCGLSEVGHLLTSSDSLAWSDAARRRPVRLPGCSHGKDGLGNCANCARWAMVWRSETVAAAGSPPPQLSLWGAS